MPEERENSTDCTNVFSAPVARRRAVFWWNPDKFVGPAGLLPLTVS